MTSRILKIKLLETRNKKKNILKTRGKKRHITQSRTYIRMMADFFSTANNANQNTVQQNLKVLTEKTANQEFHKQ